MKLEELVKERIEENKSIFCEEELLKINANYSILIKVYTLALLDSKNL